MSVMGMDMSDVVGVGDPASWAAPLALAQVALARGELAVVPTDTVYGIAADAFSPAAVARLLAAKGRGRQKPPPVLVASVQTLDALAVEVSDDARALADAFWPGALTLILLAQPSLMWDLGDTAGTVALRMPDNAATLALLTSTGPLAVSSANKTEQPAATSVAQAQEQLGDSVAVYLDGGPSSGSQPSTIVDASVPGRLVVVREGALSIDRLAEVAPSIRLPEQDQPA